MREHEHPVSHRVLYLIDRLLSTAGGAEGVLHKLCCFLPSRGFRCSIATFGAREGVEQQFPCPVRVLLSRPYHWTSLPHALAFARLLHSERIEIVHTFFPTSDLWGGVVARLSGCPILVSSRRDMGIVRSRKHRVPYILMSPLFTQVQAVSEKVREFCIREDHLPPEKVVTVPNGVDLEAIDAHSSGERNALFGLNGNSRVITTVANVRSVKGIDILIRAAVSVVEQVSEAHFVVIGETQEPSYLQELLELARQLGVARNISFIGGHNDVYALLKASDLFCLPSRSEGMSNALLEAMACRLPCVATDVGGNPEVVIDGQTGFLVPTENPHALATQIIALLRDRDLMGRMGQAGRRTVQLKFTVQHMVDRVALLYDQLLRQKGLSTCVTELAQTDSSRAKAIVRLSED
jgi:glycosyltransferase involved in cell wall biosynthesis